MLSAALYERDARRGLQIAYCSRAARAHGIRPGMPVAEATALASGAPGCAPLRLAPYEPLSARAALVALAAWCQKFSPLVGLEEAERPECLLLDVTGLAPLFQGERALVERVAREFRAAGWQARLALADTIGAAWALAHYAALGVAGVGRQDAPSSGPKNLGARFAQPQAPSDSAIVLDESLVVPPGESPAAVARLPIEALRLDAEPTRLLHELGLTQIGQLELLPRAALATRFGPVLLRRWDQLAGAAEEVLRAAVACPTPEATWTSEQPIARADVIEAILERLLEQLTATLASEQRGVLRLECRLKGSAERGTMSAERKSQMPEPSRSSFIAHRSALPAAGMHFSVGLFRPSAAPRYLFELVRLRLERLRLTEPVSEIQVAVTMTELLECRQAELFATAAGRDDPRELAALVDRLSSRLGRQRVLRACLSRDAQPEQACRYEPLVGESPGRAAAGRQARSKAGRRADRLAPRRKDNLHPADERRFKWSERPLRLAGRPVPLAVTAVVPDGPLLWFTLAGQQHRIARSWGPERIETGWWRGRSVRRDYYRVETVGGHRHWLFRRLSDGQWFWHGDFE